jgi:hypothetical protein
MSESHSLTTTLARLLVAAAFGDLGCGAGAPADTAWTAPSRGVKGASSGSDVERFFPLVDGNVYHYVTLDDDNAQGLLVARVFRADAAHGELQFPSGARRFEYVRDGVQLQATGGRLADGAFVLKGPLEIGSSWRGEHGGQTKIVGIDVEAVVPAGRYGGCVQTVEERGGDNPAKWATTFCPLVGIVILEAAGGGRFERAELKSYGPPVAIGPDGLQRIP